MIIAKNDEEKRSRIWRIVTTVSSALIVIIGIYLLTKMFTTNPLEGEWIDENGRIDLNIKSNGTMTMMVLGAGFRRRGPCRCECEVQH